jgi:hypothetical protein
LYGLKQGGYLWNKVIDGFLQNLGYKTAAADRCCYIKVTKEGFILIGLYVDDLIVVPQDRKTWDKDVIELTKRFKLQDLGAARRVLGMLVTRHNDGSFFLNQSEALREVLEAYGMGECATASTPMVIRPKGPFELLCATEIKQYQAMVGSLMYISTCTRPDLSFSVSQASRYMQSPSKYDMTAVKRIMRYAKGTINFGLTFEPSANQKVTVEGVFSDSTWASEPQAKSVTGYLVCINNTPISWKSRVQPTTALSSGEAEFMALCDAAKEVMWMRQFLADIGHQQREPTVIFVDSQSAIAFAKGEGKHDRTKILRFDIILSWMLCETRSSF